jgi:hypothetical protein
MNDPLGNSIFSYNYSTYLLRDIPKVVKRVQRWNICVLVLHTASHCSHQSRVSKFAIEIIHCCIVDPNGNYRDHILYVELYKSFIEIYNTTTTFMLLLLTAQICKMCTVIKCQELLQRSRWDRYGCYWKWSVAKQWRTLEETEEVNGTLCYNWIWLGILDTSIWIWIYETNGTWFCPSDTSSYW